MKSIMQNACKGLPHIRLSMMVCCPKCGLNQRSGTEFLGEYKIEDFLQPPMPEPKFTCRRCGQKFDVSPNRERAAEIKKGLLLLDESNVIFEKALKLYYSAYELIEGKKGGV